jgi:phage/plasmid-like protein (TIGR03299 family)
MIRMADKNAQFDGEKIAQLAAEAAKIEKAAERLAMFRERESRGEVRIDETGDGTFRVTMLTGWDRGETFTVRTNGTVDMNHGLDLKENGDAALYLMSDQPAWHGLGTVVPEGLRTGAEVLRAAGLDWTVEQTPTTFVGPDGKMREVPNSYVNFRSDTFEPLGTVGKLYFPFQNLTAYSILDELLGYGMIAKSAGSFRGGTKVFVSAEVPSDLVIDPSGVADVVKQYVVITNTHDGNGSLIASMSEWYPRCANTHRLAIKNATATYKIRHTRGGLNKIEEARVVLGLAADYHSKFVAEETTLAQTDFATNDLDKLITEVFGEPDPDSKRGVTLDAKRREKIHEFWEVELARLGATAFAAENAITGYLDHAGELRPRGELKGNRLAALGQALLEDTTMDKKTTAHKALMLRVR